jgi:hypothetical protein
MSIEESAETKIPAPKKKRKVAKKRAAAAKPAPKAADGIYTGLTVKDCCNACNAQGCVISGSFYCAHPRKGGLHAAEQQDGSAMQRRRDAEKVIGKQKLVVND